MKNHMLALILMIGSMFMGHTQNTFDVVGLCVVLPQKGHVNEFVRFIENDLGPQGINTLVLRVDYKYAYTSRPELQDDDALSKLEIKQLVAACKKQGINLIPQVNLLGHQSWHSTATKLLEVYPEFDETPHIKLPENYVWPNADGLYCKSYCPLHPKVHEVVFDLMDEIVTVFEAKAFHAGMDEVFYLADENCPRCKGKSKAALYAAEITKISTHLAKTNTQLWIWGDRLIEGTESGIGIWEGSGNNTETAIDAIPKSVVINDWHYEQAVPTPAYFAMKGFDVIACPWRKPKVAEAQVKMINNFRNNTPEPLKNHFKGIMHTVWSSAESFIKSYQEFDNAALEKDGQAATLKMMIETIQNLENATN